MDKNDQHTLRVQINVQVQIIVRSGRFWKIDKRTYFRVQSNLKNHQDKNQLDFKNQIINDQLDQISFQNH